MIARLAATLALALGTAQAADAPREIGVCADPDNLPYSNSRLEGFENRIAQLVAEDLKATLRYHWRAQGRGFVRHTLGAQQCELVLGVPSDYPPVLPTRPYYRSTYVFVSRADRGLTIDSFDDPALRELRIGLHAIGDDGANPPPAHALARRGIVRNVVGFKVQDAESVAHPQSRIIEAVAHGEIDLAIIWGPLAGYFAGQQGDALRLVPVVPPADRPALPYAYDISMGVRKSDPAWKAELDEILQRRQDDIRAILQQYGVPLLEPGRAALSH